MFYLSHIKFARRSNDIDRVIGQVWPCTDVEGLSSGLSLMLLYSVKLLGRRDYGRR
jgi:hypothetical protein